MVPYQSSHRLAGKGGKFAPSETILLPLSSVKLKFT